MDIISAYPWWYYFLCVLLGLTFGFLLYRKDKKLVEFSKAAIGLLFFLRVLIISLLAVLLSSPLIRSFNKTIEKPIILIAQDFSASMLVAKDSTIIKEKLNDDLSKLVNNLSSDFEVNRIGFGNTTSNYSDSLNYDQNVTNFENLFETVQNKYVNRNIGGLILVSDGIFNRGSNPKYLPKFGFPIFSIATGDTTVYKDLKLKNLKANELAFLGNEFPIQFDVNLKKVNLSKVTYTIYKAGKKIKSNTVNVSNSAFTISDQLKASQVGKQRYDVILEAIEGEQNILNNKSSFYIDIVDGRQKVLILAAAPHPDINALKQAISINENYQVITSIYSDFKKNIEEYDLLVLHQAANATNFSFTNNSIKITDSKTPILLIGGGWQTLDTRFGIIANTRGANLKNESQALINNKFTPFTISKGLMTIQDFPPLSVAPIQIQNANVNTTLLYQKLGNVETNYPLLSFFEKGNRKIGKFNAEGFWRWRMGDYKLNESFDITNDLIGKTVQYLAVKSDRNYFRVNSVNSVFENEPINFSAQLFNPSYELVNEAEVKLMIENEKGEKFNSIFSKSSNAYQLIINSLPEGNYTYIASTILQGKTLNDRGSFNVKKLELEQQETRANHNLLFQLSENSNGKFLTFSEMNQLSKLITERDDITSISYIDEEVEEIINLKWIFYLFIFILAIEWFVRKRGGAY